jgi:hypothetical protein
MQNEHTTGTINTDEDRVLRLNALHKIRDVATLAYDAMLATVPSRSLERDTIVMGVPAPITHDDEQFLSALRGQLETLHLIYDDEDDLDIIVPDDPSGAWQELCEFRSSVVLGMCGIGSLALGQDRNDKDRWIWYEDTVPKEIGDGLHVIARDDAELVNVVTNRVQSAMERLSKCYVTERPTYLDALCVRADSEVEVYADEPSVHIPTETAMACRIIRNFDAIAPYTLTMTPDSIRDFLSEQANII